MSQVTAAASAMSFIGFKGALDTAKRTNETLASDMAEGSRRIQQQSNDIQSRLNGDIGSRLDITV